MILYEGFSLLPEHMVVLPGVFRMHHHVYFESAAGICTFVLLGRYMEERAKGKAGEAIRKLIELQPETALRIEADVTLEALAMQKYPAQPKAREKFMRMMAQANPGMPSSFE